MIIRDRGAARWSGRLGVVVKVSVQKGEGEV